MALTVAAAVVSAMVSSCSPSAQDGNEVDVDAAARAAQGDIDRYAADRRRRSTRLAPSATKGAPPSAAVDPGSAAAARQLVERYFAAIASGDAVDARRDWGHGGADCGRTSEAFAATFATVTALKASVGAVGEPDAGAGQRYVTVPASVRATVGGTPVAARRTLTLHRVADGIDSDDPAAHEWRIVGEASPAGTALPLPCLARPG